MSEPLTTAQILVIFAEELSTSDAISSEAVDELVIAAGRSLIEHGAGPTVKHV